MTVELIQGDCMDVMKQYPDNHFDLACVDPPYGIDVGNTPMSSKWGSSRLAKKDWDKSAPDEDYFQELRRVSVSQIVWGANYFPQCWPVRAFIVWDKGEGFKGRSFAECEIAASTIDGNPKIYKRDPLAGGDYRGKIHPTQKPVKLYDWLLANYAKPGDRILDTHLGSGSSAIAAHYGGFDFVGIELDEDYYRAACERFDRETAQQAMF